MEKISELHTRYLQQLSKQKGFEELPLITYSDERRFLERLMSRLCPKKIFANGIKIQMPTRGYRILVWRKGELSEGRGISFFWEVCVGHIGEAQKYSGQVEWTWYIHTYSNFPVISGGAHTYCLRQEGKQGTPFWLTKSMIAIMRRFPRTWVIQVPENTTVPSWCFPPPLHSLRTLLLNKAPFKTNAVSGCFL